MPGRALPRGCRSARRPGASVPVIGSERSSLDAEEQATVQRITLVGQYRQSTGAFNGSPGAVPAPGHITLHVEQGRISLVSRAPGPLPAGLHQGGHSLSFRLSRAVWPSTPCARTGARPGGRSLLEAADGFGDKLLSLQLIHALQALGNGDCSVPER